MKKKIVVGLSGGVDSSTTAYILKQQGWEVIGVTLKLSSTLDSESLSQARQLCGKLEIPHHLIDLGDAFKKEIVDYFVQSYLEGTTPNPCAWCNRRIKFGVLLERAKKLGADYLATGHYARIEKTGDTYFIKRAKDERKSQEYFLSLIPSSVLPHLVFPLADYTKEEVRRVAKEKELMFKERKESQDICFIKGMSYAKFIEKYLDIPSEGCGQIQHVDGRILGTHKGIHHYTYGQREGLGVAWKEPLYVADIDSATKTVVVTEREHLGKDRFLVGNLNWFICPENFSFLKVKIRYNSLFYNCKLEYCGNKILVLLEKKIDAITPGQLATFYRDDMVVGGGIIEKIKS
ncbi:MAG: tRNA 2-thiouridine(34) synthase MnmA [Candidatus Omnitrophota bacterium]|nr:MAG: tRNA 2-thiouridine(34) synthase MnmA [Candidatus Omnitrophota bacterium]